MGDEADYLIERSFDANYQQQRYYEWIQQGRHTPINARCVVPVPHAIDCKCPGCMHSRRLEAETAYAKKRRVKPKPQPAPLSIELAFKEVGPYGVPTNIICNRCQAVGLHWGLKDGKPEMREEGGWSHKCKKIEGVTLNLPDILNPQ